MKIHTQVSTGLIAVIGMACRFPGRARDVSSFWQVLESGSDEVSSVPPGRFAASRYYSNSKSLGGHSYTLSAGVISGIKEFDPHFFGISRKEAQDMDPQQRLALEIAWECLEQAQIPPASLRGSFTGVYFGASGHDMSMQIPDDPCIASPYSMTGANLSIIANRVSYILDLHGPSMTVDTACSSSLVAVHLACEALRSGETDIALAGGVNILLGPYGFMGFSQARMLSPDGRCKVFDASGNGYVRSEGAGCLLLKPLSMAIKDGNSILAVIAGTGVNSDGHTTGIALPNGEKQAELLRTVYERFGLDKEKLVYVEAHGTGTAAGDPIEATSIGTVLGQSLKGKRILTIGSVKSNIGHLESASGMAGIIKSILMLRHDKIPANLHFNTPNPAINFAELNLQVPLKLHPLPSAGGSELISVNSFGFGGANAHVVLQRPDTIRKKRLASKRGSPLPPFFLSAASPYSLRQLAAECADCIVEKDDTYIYDFARALAEGKDIMPLRKVIWGKNHAELRNSLLNFAAGEEALTSCPAFGPVVAQSILVAKGAFVFSGNGSQWKGMGKTLFESDACFRKSVEEVDSLLCVYQPWSLAKAFGEPESFHEDFSRSEINQPLLFAIQVALVRMLDQKGIRPSAVMGHSVGEVAAAWAAGVLSLEDAVTVIYHRSRLQGVAYGKGRMAAANISAARAEKLLADYGGKVEISAVNTDSSISLSSTDEQSLTGFVDMLRDRRIAVKMLDLPYPYHTASMDGIREELLASLSGIKAKKPKIPFYSTVTGKKLTRPADAAYWFANIREPVLFAAASKTAFTDGLHRFLEIGPHPVLRSYLRDGFQKEHADFSVVPTLFNMGDEVAAFDAAWTSAWQRGWQIDKNVFFPYAGERVELPTYAWDREYLWPDDSPHNRGFLKAERVHPLLGWPLPGNAPVYENVISMADFPWLADHVVGNGPVYPAAAFIESALAAGAQLHPGKQIELERVAISRPLSFEENAANELRLLIDNEDGGFRIETRKYLGSEPWGTRVKGRIRPVAENPPDPGLSFAAPETFGTEVSTSSLYEDARRMLRYGKSFRTVEKAWLRPDIKTPEILTKFCLPDEESSRDMHIPPTLVDGSMQSLFILLAAQNKEKRRTFLPVSFEKIILYAKGLPRYAHTRLERISERSIVASFRLLDQGGNTLLSLKNCRFRRAFWLEHENADSRPYTLELAPRSHPDTVSALTGIDPKEIIRLADASIQQTLNSSDQAQGHSSVHPYLLLQLAALSSAHETALSLCGSPTMALQCGSRELIDAGLLDPKQESWFYAMLNRLEDGELATRSNERWLVQPRGERAKAEMLWRTILGISPRYLPEASLLSHIFGRHAKILSGAAGDDEKAILSSKLVQNYFSNSAILQPYRLAALKAVESVLRAGTNGQTINILHIAKNPPDLLSEVLPLLKVKPCNYVVAEKNDVSAEAHAMQFGTAPSLSFSVLDPTCPDKEHKDKYHLILLFWSLHEYLNSAKVLESCRDMLAPGGILCVLEHNASAFTDYVFGAAPSWWAASPSLCAPVSLMQGSKYWVSALRKSGFSDIAQTGKPETAFRPAFLLSAIKPVDTNQTSEDVISIGDAAIEEDTAPATPEPHWVIVADSHGGKGHSLGAALMAQLEGAGGHCTLVPYMLEGSGSTSLTHSAVSNNSTASACPASSAVSVCSADSVDSGSLAGPDGSASPDRAAEDWWQKTVFAMDPTRPLHVVFCAAYDNRTDIPERELFELQSGTCLALAALARTWDSLRPDMRLWVVSGGAISDGIPEACPVASQGAVAGFLRVMGNEMRRVPVTLLDVHGDDEAALAHVSDLAREALHPTDDTEIVFSSGARYVPRLSRFTRFPQQRGAEADKLSATLGFDVPGRLQNLHWTQNRRPEPAADEVCVEVKYTGLNFRDVMWSMGMLPDEALENGFSGPTMGMECSGVISSTGKDVKGWKPGDEVICFAPACFATHAVTKASAIVRKPSTMSFAEGATIPVAFITAWYSLKHLARMQPGESILIHGAAGGVGLAALQIAEHLDLKIYATAGPEEKHAFLRQLGVERLYSSRSLSFAEEILEDTRGKGVDAVLNSLAGEAIPAGLSVLRPFGRFLELGKRDFFADSPMRLRPFSNNISFFGIDVDQLLVHQPALARQLFSELMTLFEERKLHPLPHTVFPVVRTVDAFQTMQQSGHIGKLVVSMDGAATGAVKQETALSKLYLKADATYLVTGGTGGFGLATASRLARRGAKHIVLLSRKGITDEAAMRSIAGIRANGVRIVEAKADVANREQLFACLDMHLKHLPPLAGVVHAAAALDDTLITGLDRRRIRHSLAAKALGAVNLHAYSLDKELDFFVLYSSVSSAFGNPGQSMYVAANSTLETLGAWRRSLGLPAQVIGWGPIADTGMMARDSSTRDKLFKMLGVTPTPVQEALYWLEHCVAENIGDSYYFGLVWDSRTELPVLSSPRFNRLRPAITGIGQTETPALDQIRTMPQDEGIALILQMLVEEITRILRLPKDRLMTETPLISQGMDSLMAVELALAIEQKFELPGYNLSLAESSTALDLARALHTHVRESAGAGGDDVSRADETIVTILEQKHGFRLSEQKREAVVQSMKEGSHEY